MEEYMPIVLLIVISVNGLWYVTKVVLKENGYQISWFKNHFQDISNVFHLANKTENKGKKILYYLMAIGLPLGLAIFIISFFVIVDQIRN